MRPKVSIIVPVYNTEEYLVKCLNSLVQQSLNDIEIIVVDDGSTDNSQTIIRKYTEQYPDKIISFKKENGGLGDARNFGLEYATGEFIGFVDSDDWVDTKMYEMMYKEALHGYDIVLCDLIDGKSNSISKGFRGFSFNNKNIIMYSTDPAFACNKLFKKQMFNIIKFPTHWYEDIGTIPILMTYSNKIGYVESPFYYYTQRQDSITSNTSEKTLGVIQAWARVLENANLEYMDEAIFAVYRSISAFIFFKPMYVDKFIEFIGKNKLVIQKNKYYMEAVKNGQVIDLISLISIPNSI